MTTGYKQTVEHIAKRMTSKTITKISASMKGRSPKNLLYVHSLPRTDDWKNRMSQSNTGKKDSPAGKNHYNWKGGITPINVALRNSLEYKLWREAVFKRENYTCQGCGIRSGNGITVVLNADHVKPFALFPELRLSIDNGVTLCVTCHRKTPTYGGKTKLL